MSKDKGTWNGLPYISQDWENRHELDHLTTKTEMDREGLRPTKPPVYWTTTQYGRYYKLYDKHFTEPKEVRA